MRFSVITPCASNDIKCLGTLQKSLQAQASDDFEWVIAVNDATALPKSITEQAHVVSSQGKTPGAALHAAVLAAHGDFLVFAAADDYFRTQALMTLSQAIKAQQTNRIYDLNVYPTYEPRAVFAEARQDEHLPEDALPAYGGKRRKTVDAEILKDSFTRAKLLHLVREIYHGHRVLPPLYQLIGKVVPREVGQRLAKYLDQTNPLYSSFAYLLNLELVLKQPVVLDDFYYVQVHHNDLVADPSLQETIRPDRWILWLKACFHADQTLPKTSAVRKAFERWTISYLGTFFYYDFARQREQLPTDLGPFYLLLRKYVQQLTPRALHVVKYVSRRAFKFIEQENFPQAEHVMVQVCDLRYLHGIIRHLGRGRTKLRYFKKYIHLPVDPHVILFESFLGRNFSDNPKYVFLYLQKHYQNAFKFVWVADKEHLKQIKHDLKDFPNTIVVRRWGYTHMRYLATAKYFVYNMRQPRWFVKRPGMRFIQTWHGTPLKQLVYDIKYIGGTSLHEPLNYTLAYKRIFYHQSRQWDHLVTDNPFSYNAFKSAFRYPQAKMLKSGYPRNDILSAPNKAALAKRIKTKLGIPLDKKVILYAPTWRDNDFSGHGEYNFELTLDINKLKQHFGKDYVLILRTHYFVTSHLNTAQYGDFVYDESTYDDISELYLISDVLITDYSSVFFDYANLKRPILFFVYDYDEYVTDLHGFYLNMEKDLPGPLIKTNQGIIHALDHLDEVQKKYHDRYQKFYQRFDSWDDGYASQRVVHALLK